MSWYNEQVTNYKVHSRRFIVEREYSEHKGGPWVAETGVYKEDKGDVLLTTMSVIKSRS